MSRIINNTKRDDILHDYLKGPLFSDIHVRSHTHPLTLQSCHDLNTKKVTLILGEKSEVNIKLLD